MKINGFEISERTGFYVKRLDIQTRKNIRVSDLKYQHGVKMDKNAYFDGLEIIISGDSFCNPYKKNDLIKRMNYGLFKLEFDDGWYFVECRSINFTQVADVPNIEHFQIVLVSPTPFKYEYVNYEMTLPINDNTYKISTPQIKLPITDVNFQFSGSTTIYTRGYRIMSLDNDVNNTTTIVTENYITNFDMKYTSIVASFTEQTYISRFMLYFDEIDANTMKKGDIKIYYLDTTYKQIDSNYSLRLLDGSVIGKSGKVLYFEDVNVQTNNLKIRYEGNNTTLADSDYKFISDETRKNCAIIIPEYFSYCKNETSSTIFLNTQQGITEVDGLQNVSALKGQSLRIFPNETYFYATNPTEVKINFTNYNFYEVEHV